MDARNPAAKRSSVVRRLERAWVLVLAATLAAGLWQGYGPLLVGAHAR